jgi:hypothetical protein
VIVKAEPQEQGPALAKFADTRTAGVYEVQLTANDNTLENIAVAYNVDAAEGALKMVTREQLEKELPDVDVAKVFQQASELYLNADEMQGANLSDTVLYALVFLLLAEQLLSYFVSYHPPRTQGAR